MNPGEVKPRTFDRLPSWKIQTRAPKLAVIERRVITIALSGMTSEPNSRNRIRPLARRVMPTAYGTVAALAGHEVVALGGEPADLGRDAVDGTRPDRGDDGAARRADRHRSG